jgi:hypothetical protein
VTDVADDGGLPPKNVAQAFEPVLIHDHSLERLCHFKKMANNVIEGGTVE